MRVLGLVPARGGSKGVPRKNVRRLGGKPLLSYTLDVAKAAEHIDEVVVSTDDDEIAQVAADCGYPVPFMRPPALADDDSSSIDVVLHALNYLRGVGREYDAVCLLQPTTPFRRVGAVDRAIELLRDSSLDTVMSVIDVPHTYHPNWVFLGDATSRTLRRATESPLVKRRQELPSAYARDGAIYVNRVATLESTRDFTAGLCGYVEDTCWAAVNVDTLDDWRTAEEIIAASA